MKHPTALSWIPRIGLILNLGLSLSYIGLWLLAASQQLTWRADFTAFYTGGAIVRDGLGHSLYDYELQMRYQQEILGGKSFAEGLLAFNYPPYVAFMTLPLSFLPLPAAYTLWSIIEIAVLGTLLWQAHTFAVEEEWGRTPQTRLLIAIAALPSLMVAMLLGTFTPWGALCLLQFYRALRKGSDTQAGLWLVLGSVKPQVMVLPALALLGSRRWRAIETAAAFFLALFTVTGLTLGWNVWMGFLHALTFTGAQFGTFGVVPGDMYNLKGTLSLWFGDAHTATINAISWSGFGLACLATLWLWHRQAKQPDVARFDLITGLVTALGMLFGPHVNPQDGFLLAIPLLWFYNYLAARKHATQGWWIFLTILPLLMLTDTYGIEARLKIRVPVLILIFLCGWMGQAWVNDTLHPAKNRLEAP